MKKNIYHVNPYWIMKQLDMKLLTMQYEHEQLLRKYEELKEYSKKRNIHIANIEAYNRKIMKENNVLKNNNQIKLDDETLRIREHNKKLNKELKEWKAKASNYSATIIDLKAQLEKAKNKSISTILKEKLTSVIK